MTLVLQTPDLLSAVVAQLIAFVSDRGQSIGTICSGHVYIRKAPSDVAKPYVVITKAVGESDAEYANLLESFEIDALCVDDDPARVELLGDLAQQALLTFRYSSQLEGLCRCVATRRATPEADQDPALSDRQEVIVTAECSVVPAKFTVLSHTAT
jgi:hypothetical protein